MRTGGDVLGLALVGSASGDSVVIVGLDLDADEPDVVRLRALIEGARVVSFTDAPAAPGVVTYARAFGRALIAARSIRAEVVIMAHDARKLTTLALAMKAERVLLYKGGRLTRVSTASFLKSRAPIVEANHGIRRLRELAHYAPVAPAMHQSFVIVSCERNAGAAAARCLTSVFEQTYPRDLVDHVFVDDASTDDTRAHVQAWLGNHPAHRVQFVENSQRLGGTLNTRNAFRAAPATTIVCELNGDDWLPDPGVFAYLNKVYQDPSVWMTYNSCVFADGTFRALNRPYSAETIQSRTYRNDDWHAGAMRTFRSELFSHVTDHELIDPATGRWWESADDMVIFLAMLEMSGSHARHVERPTYVYNHRDQSEDVRDLTGGRLRGERIRAMRKHKPLASLVTSVRTESNALVSVLMPVFNAGPYLDQAITSILEQTHTNLELIIVNDGSTDESRDVMQRYEKNDGRVKIIDQANLGLVAALNRGLAETKGTMIARMDGDDTCSSERLAHQLEFLEANESVGAVGSWVERIDGSGHPLGQRWETPIAAGVIGWMLFFESCLPHGSVMMRRSVIDEVGGYDASARHAEDYDLWIRMDQVTRLANLPLPLLQLRIHDSRVGVRHNEEQEQTGRRLLRARCERFLERTVSDEVANDLFILHRRRPDRALAAPSIVTETLVAVHHAYVSQRRLDPSEREAIDFDAAKKLAFLAKRCAVSHPIAAANALAEAVQIDPRSVARRGGRRLLHELGRRLDPA